MKECEGCHGDFYNWRPDAASRCWYASDGVMMTRYQIHYMQAPAAKGAFTKVRKPSCYHQLNANVFYDELPSFVMASDLRKDRRV